MCGVACIIAEIIAKSDKFPHEYSAIVGIEESAHEIFMNFKEIALGTDR